MATLEKESPLASLIAETAVEVERVEAELKELGRLVDQSRSEVEKLAQRNALAAAQLRQVQSNLEGTPRTDIKATYEAVQDAQQRLMTMRGQLEKMQGEQASLDRLAEYLRRSLQSLRAASASVTEADTLPIIVRVVEAQEAERQRLSRQIHDGPAQALSNFILQTEIAMRLFDVDTARAKSELQSLKNAATSTFQQVRDFIFDLRPMMLDDLGLAPTVKRYADAYREKTTIPINLTITGGDRRLDPAREVVVFRGIQALLANVRQHAQASQVRLLVDLDAQRARVTVEDNGKGFDPQAVLSGKHKGTGLLTLKERMDLLGGHLQIESQAGQGTRVVLDVPAGG